MTLAALGSDLLAKGAEILLRAAIGHDALDPGHGLSDARHLALGLPATADDAERARVPLGEVLAGDAARCPGAQLSQLVGLDHGRELRTLGVEEDDDERRSARQPRIRLHPGEPELVVDR